MGKVQKKPAKALKEKNLERMLGRIVRFTESCYSYKAPAVNSITSYISYDDDDDDDDDDDGDGGFDNDGGDDDGDYNYNLSYSHACI